MYFCLDFLKKQNKTKHEQTNKYKLLIKSEAHFDLPQSRILLKSEHPSPPMDPQGSFENSEFHRCVYSFLDVKFKLYTIFIIPNKKWNLYSVGLQKQLLKLDISINILIKKHFFPYSFGESLKTNVSMA